MDKMSRELQVMDGGVGLFVEWVALGRGICESDLKGAEWEQCHDLAIIATGNTTRRRTRAGIERFP